MAKMEQVLTTGIQYWKWPNQTGAAIGNISDEKICWRFLIKVGNTFSIIAFYKEISQQRSVDLSYFLDRTPGSLFKIWNKRRGACWEEGAQSKGEGGGVLNK